MQIVVSASDEQWLELTQPRPEINWLRVDDAASFYQYDQAVVFLSLKNDSVLPGFESLHQPVFINSVVKTLTDLRAANNVYRMNGWPTFLGRSVWEIAGQADELIISLFKSFISAFSFLTNLCFIYSSICNQNIFWLYTYYL